MPITASLACHRNRDNLLAGEYRRRVQEIIADNLSKAGWNGAVFQRLRIVPNHSALGSGIVWERLRRRPLERSRPLSRCLGPGRSIKRVFRDIYAPGKGIPEESVLTDTNGLRSDYFNSASLGFEPRQRDSESLVLPLHHEATSGEKLKADWTRAQPAGRGR